MAVSFVEFQGQIMDAGFFHHVVYFFYAGAEVSDGVVFSGDDQQGKIFGDFICVFLSACKRYGVEQAFISV